MYKRMNLAHTLQKIGQNGPDEFYVGNTANNLISDLQEVNSILTLGDLRNYR